MRETTVCLQWMFDVQLLQSNSNIHFQNIKILVDLNCNIFVWIQQLNSETSWNKSNVIWKTFWIENFKTLNPNHSFYWIIIFSLVTEFEMLHSQWQIHLTRKRIKYKIFGSTKTIFPCVLSYIFFFIIIQSEKIRGHIMSLRRGRRSENGTSGILDSLYIK